MFHSVGNDQHFNKPQLSVSLKHFKTFCRYLQRRKYRTILLDEWYYLQDNPKKITGKEIVLTFDDGYLDNWVYVYPLLEKHGLCGTIFVNPEFVDPSDAVRTNLAAVGFDEKKLSWQKTLGFANWQELRIMSDSGIMDIQSHSMSHNRYFKDNQVKDIYTGQKGYEWLAWSELPASKPFYLTQAKQEFPEEGYPIFAHDRALSLKRYFPDDRLIEKARDMFREAGSKKEVIEELNLLVKNKYPGSFETEAAMEKRYRYELFESRAILEEKMGKEVRYLCWPGGGYNEQSLQMSVEAGYKASTVPPKHQHQITSNTQPYKRIKRFGMGSFVLTPSGYKYLVGASDYLVHNFRGRTGNRYSKYLNRLRRIPYLLKDYASK